MPLALTPLVDQLKAAAEPTRLRLLAACAISELTVTELTGIVDQSQPRVSRHLKKLCAAGLLLRFRERHHVFYRVPAAGAVRRLVRALLAQLASNDAVVAQDLSALKAALSARAQRAQAVLDAAPHAGVSSSKLDQSTLDDAIMEAIDPGAIGNLLDIGTGTAQILRLLGPHARSAVGIDISEDMLLVARSNVYAAGLSGVMVHHGDMYRLPYPDHTFDTITVDQVLREADNPQRVLREAARILKPGGQLIIIEIVGTGDAALGQLRDWVGSASLVTSTAKQLGVGNDSVALCVVHHRNDKRDAA